MARTALIVGSAGQDGTLLQESLRAKGYRLLCIEVGTTRGEELGWATPIDITSPADVLEVVGAVRPDEVYHLAAIHHSSEEDAPEDLDLFRVSYEVNFFSLLNFLEAIRLRSKATRLFYAASSHIFEEPSGDGPSQLQTEETPLAPQSIYGMTKVDGLLACRRYRSRHHVFAAAGILYNHESKYRPEKFLTRKVINAVAEIKQGKRSQLVLADLAAEVDWGYAPDYIEAMHAILGAEAPDEFIVATGERHTVKEFVEAAFEEAGLDWREYVRESRPSNRRRPQGRIGDPSKLTRVTGWKPRTDFFDMVRLLLHDELTKSA